MDWFKPDLSKPTCRVCLKNKIDEEMSSIFDMDTELHDLPIYEKIERCAGIKIICNKRLPAYICCHCNERLEISYKFRTTCRSSEEYLKIIVETDVKQPKNDTPLKENDLLKEEDTSSENLSCIYQGGDDLSPIPDAFKKENSISCSPAHYEYEEEFQKAPSGYENDVWIDINYPDGEDILSCSDDTETPAENNDLKTKGEKDNMLADKKPLKAKKRSYVKKKKSNKTLEISADGAAIIKERKPRIKKGDAKQPHVCEICGNVYKRRHILEHHVKRHSDKKDFECEICGYASHSNFELRRHMRKHTGSRPYKCSYCPSAFADHSTLTKHERVHRNERPFKCDICGSSFSYPGVLKRHKLVHTGEKPYKCEICGKCFNDRYHLQSHLKTIQHKNDPRVESLIRNIRENNV